MQLTWIHLRAIAEPLYSAYRQLCHEAAELVTGRLGRPTRTVPPTLGLSHDLEVAFHGQIFARRYERDARLVIEVEFEAVAEVRRRDAGRIVAFQFTTTWPQSEASIASPEHRVVVQR